MPGLVALFAFSVGHDSDASNENVDNRNAWSAISIKVSIEPLINKTSL